MTDIFDFNDAGKQKSFDVIPDNVIAILQLKIRPGGAGPDGWLTRAKDGNSEHVSCEFTVVDGEHAKRKFFANYTVTGVNHVEASEISRKILCAMLESAGGIRPDDKSDGAKAARHVRGWQDFDQLRFVARIGVEPPRNGYAAKNKIKEVITPERHEWKKPEQIANAPAPAQPTTQPAATLANAITRPLWAQSEKKADR